MPVNVLNRRTPMPRHRANKTLQKEEPSVQIRLAIPMDMAMDLGSQLSFERLTMHEFVLRAIRNELDRLLTEPTLFNLYNADNR